MKRRRQKPRRHNVEKRRHAKNTLSVKKPRGVTLESHVRQIGSYMSEGKKLTTTEIAFLREACKRGVPLQIFVKNPSTGKTEHYEARVFPSHLEEFLSRYQTIPSKKERAKFYWTWLQQNSALFALTRVL